MGRSVDFYERALGLRVHDRGDGAAFLGAGADDLLVLREEPGARPVRGHTGLYRYALLVPARADLARWFLHASSTRVPLAGLSDPAVSEAIYLADPDGHGIEIYRDRPRAEWPVNGKAVHMVTLPLDADSLLGSLEAGALRPFERMPRGTRMGHVHVHVADLESTERFYADVLGFDLTARLGAQAAFFAAGGYHHHFGANTWAGAGTSPPPGSAALRYATIVLPDEAERDRVAARVAAAGQEPQPAESGLMVRDPSRNALLLTLPAGEPLTAA